MLAQAPRPGNRGIALRLTNAAQRRPPPRPLTAPRGAGMLRRMRYSDRKIESLAEKLVHWLESQSDIQLLEPRDVVRDALIAEFQDERAVERKLDEDVDRILEQNEGRMRSEGVDPWLMRKKVRGQMARDRGIVL